MLQDHVAPLLLAMVIATHSACLLALISVLRARTAEFPGWRVVQPSGTHWFCFVGCWAFATLITWVWLFVGSARRDAEVQMGWALLLILAFGIASAGVGFYIAQLLRLALRWPGPTVAWHDDPLEPTRPRYCATNGKPRRVSPRVQWPVSLAL